MAGRGITQGIVPKNDTIATTEGTDRVIEAGAGVPEAADTGGDIAVLAVEVGAEVEAGALGDIGEGGIIEGAPVKAEVEAEAEVLGGSDATEKIKRAMREIEGIMIGAIAAIAEITSK